jgi:hypothetical protein
MPKSKQILSKPETDKESTDDEMVSPSKTDDEILSPSKTDELLKQPKTKISNKNIPTTNFYLSNYNNLKKLLQKESDEHLKFYQNISKLYFANSKKRGMLIMYEMGFGKTIGSIAIAKEIEKQDPDRKIVVLVAKSLVNNYIDNIVKYNNAHGINESREDVEDNYNFVSLNASNMYKQVSALGDVNEIISPESLENTLLIIDEAHLLFNSIVNGSKNGLSLYNLIMNTKNIKLIFLSGTPMINSPFELVPCFNMLNGTTLFPEFQDEFNSYFIEDVKIVKNGKKEIITKMKNKHKFQNRIAGMVSYYGNIFENVNSEDYPELLPIIEVKIPMSKEQYMRYYDMRERESREKAFGKNASGRFSTKSDTQSSYRIKSRLVCNALIPEYAITLKENKIVEKKINEIKEADLTDNLHVYSPKNEKVLEIINKYPRNKGYITCEFRESEGIAFTARTLEANGFELYKLSSHYVESIKNYISDEEQEENETEESKSASSKGGRKRADTAENNDDTDDEYLEFIEEYIGGAKSVKKKSSVKKSSVKKSPVKKSPVKKSLSHSGKKRYYIIISGNISHDERSQLLEVFNKKENVNGDIIAVALLTRAGAMGIELKDTLYVIHLGPYWNQMLLEQFNARGARFRSHVNLSKKDRKVQPYILLATIPENVKKEKDKLSAKTNESTSTDEYLYERAVKAKIVINEFLLALIEASVDCLIHNEKVNKVECRKCSPTNQLLYNYESNIEDDMKLSDPCKLPDQKKIKVKKIEVNGKTYYYNDKKQIFTFSEELNGYKPLANDDPDYGVVLEKIY